MSDAADEDLIYHYTSAAGLMGIINDGTHGVMRCSHALFQNDAKEYYLLLDLAKRHLDAELASTSDEAIAGVIRQARAVNPLLTREGKSFTELPVPYFASFSRKPDLLSQWRGYCPKGGYCLGFSRSILADQPIQDAGWHVVDVDYVNYDNPQLDFQTILSPFYAYLNERRERVIQIYPASGQIDCPGLPNGEHVRWNPHCEAEILSIIESLSLIMSTELFAKTQQYKDDSFREEDETRIYTHRKETDSFNLMGNTLKPYVEMQLPIKSSLKQIIIGPSHNSTLDDLGLDIFLRSKGLSIEVKHSNIPYRTAS
jgi:hypothetical protein